MVGASGLACVPGRCPVPRLTGGSVIVVFYPACVVWVGWCVLRGLAGYRNTTPPVLWHQFYLTPGGALSIIGLPAYGGGVAGNTRVLRCCVNGALPGACIGLCWVASA